MPLIDDSAYDEIRAAIDVSLTSKQVPDALISMSIYQGLAERDIINLLPTAEVDMDDPVKAVHIRRAVIFLTASHLIPQVPFIVKENFGNYSYTRKDMDLAIQADVLRGLAENEIAIITGVDVFISPVPILFTTAKASRGYGIW